MKRLRVSPACRTDVFSRVLKRVEASEKQLVFREISKHAEMRTWRQFSLVFIVYAARVARPLHAPVSSPRGCLHS